LKKHGDPVNPTSFDWITGIAFLVRSKFASEILRHAAHIHHRDGPQEHQPQRHCGLMRYFRAELDPDSIHTQEVFEKLAGKSLENVASPTGFEPAQAA